MSHYEDEDYTKRFDFGIWKRLLRYALPQKRFLIGIAILMVSAAGVDTIFPLMTRYAIDHYVSTGRFGTMPLFIAMYAGLMLLQTFNVLVFIRWAGRVETNVSYDMRKKAFHNLQMLSFSYYDKTPVGFIMTRLTSDIGRLGSTIAWALVDIVWAGAYITMSLVAMFILDWRLALFVLCTIPVLAVISLYFQKRILAQQRIVRKTNSRITGAINEGIMGARTTKSLVREEENSQEFRSLTGTMYMSSVRAAILSSAFMPIVTALGSLAVGFALWYGGRGVFLAAISFGTLSTFIAYTSWFFEPISQVARIFADFQSAQAAAERVMSLIDTKPEINDRPDVIAQYGDVFTPKREHWPVLKGEIEFDHVSFGYKGGEDVLSDFSLHVRPGETVALVGETGSGKSTIVNLVCRFYEPVEGKILIDGEDYREHPQSWLHENLGYVLQSPHLFSGTIRENIRYGCLSATDAEVEAAAQLVQADTFIHRMEKGYDTEVGEGGSRLSTGEKQLISFARALLANPRIFVLDEATSSIDTETEQIIQHAIHTALTGRTSFIIAHRLSTIRSADRILVIDKGVVIEEGTHRELMHRKGYYYKLYTNQFREEQENEILDHANTVNA